VNRHVTAVDTDAALVDLTTEEDGKSSGLLYGAFTAGSTKIGWRNPSGYGRNPGTLIIDLYVNGSFVRRDYFKVV
jgi:hypothetical protein